MIQFRESKYAEEILEVVLQERSQWHNLGLAVYYRSTFRKRPKGTRFLPLENVIAVGNSYVKKRDMYGLMWTE